MEDVQDLIMLYLFWAINDSIFKSMILVENGIILKNHVCCNFIAAKILHQDFIPTIYENFKSVFLLI